MARSKQLAPGISARVARRSLKGPKNAEPEAPATKEVQVGGDKNGSTRLVPTSKAPRYYPAEDVRQPKKSRKLPKPTKLRPSIAPGGKRVVFLKQLESGLLLVTGPYKINGVPLRRVNQAYVIATSTRVDLEGFEVDPKLNDAYFSKPVVKGAPSAEAEFFEEGKPKPKEPFPQAKSADQKEVDKIVITAVQKQANLAKYLKATFGLTKGQYPHQMVF
ncbi:ribosomal protein L6e-domain-containing protein [Boletus reticuloceps]|uniref:Ribosomal protein L6e-domain-containing protein n=1 Tax=Boletus reticuloceps TaxID=495285 RepID=A0A8I2YWK6_9AGAM|nr:ribosomal protein L6e-domain-containing protein [Boletus reticuloceps]